MDWFKHDIYCLQDDRLFTLVSRYGAEGYAVFFHTIEAMYANNGNPIYEMAVRRIAFELSLPFEKVQNVVEFAASENCGHLFLTNENGGYFSVRVQDEVAEGESRRQRYSNMGKASAERRSNISSNVGSTQVERKFNVGSTDKIREDKNRKDNKVSVVPTKYNPSIKKLSESYETDTLFARSDSDESSMPTEKEEKDPVFITISLISNEDYPIKESVVKMWEESYPAVDVRGQLREMKSWCFSNPKERKTARGIMRFCNNWLSKEQDKAGRPSGKTERNDFYGGKYIKGTDIKMDLVAKGADRSRYTNQPALEDLL